MPASWQCEMSQAIRTIHGAADVETESLVVAVPGGLIGMVKRDRVELQRRAEHELGQR